jgi:hypothetical protein
MKMEKTDRILIQDGHWTPFRNEIFQRIWGQLKQDYAAALYAILYDQFYHHPTHKASLGSLLTWPHLDEGELGASLIELQERKLVSLEKVSRAHRGTGKLRLKVPLAAHFDLNGGNWTPIPRFLIREYILAYPDSVLLLMLLHYQHLNWQNDCYPGLLTLSQQIGWPHGRVRSAVGTVSRSDLWKKIETGLPRPLTTELRPFHKRTVTHYHLRAVRYDQNNEGIRIMRLRTFALERFGERLPKLHKR